MRISYFIIALLLLAFADGKAQVSLGAFGGMNMSKFGGDQPADASYNNLLGGNYGLLIDLKLSEQVTISLQPSMSQKGTKISYSVRGELNPVDSINIKIGYFAIPLLFKIATENNRFYAIGGIEAGLPLAADALFINDPAKDKEITDHLATLSLAMHFGVGYRIPVGKPTLFVEGKYVQGLNNAVPEENPDYGFSPRVRTRDFQLLFGIEFPLF